MAISVQRALRRIRGARPRPAAGGGGGGSTVTLSFASATEDSGGGVYGVVGSTNASQQFSFAAVTPRTGLPRDLEVSESGTLKLVVTFTSDYDGQAYTYTDSSGTPHAGTFPSGNGTASY